MILPVPLKGLRLRLCAVLSCPPHLPVSRTDRQPAGSLLGALILAVTALLLAPHAVAAQEPTLARLAFWIAPDRMADFQAVYEAEILPWHEERGLVEYSGTGRATVDSVFSRLFAFSSAAQFHATRDSLRKDPELLDLAREYGPRFGSKGLGGMLKSALRLYQAPATPGTKVPAGPGRRTPLGPGQGHWRTYDVTDGLAGPMVSAMHQDPIGDLWLGTSNNGISRFDGQEWTNYDTSDGLTHNEIRAIHQDRDGDLWFGTAAGITRFDGRVWTEYTAEDEGGTSPITSIAEGPGGDLWFGTLGHGLRRFDGRKWTGITRANGLVDNLVTSMTWDSRGVLWVGTLFSGVGRFDGEHWTTFTEAEGLAENRVMSLLEDRDGHLWVGAAENGVSRYDGRDWKIFTEGDGLASDYVRTVYQDGSGNLWFCTFGHGVTRYDGETWKTFSSRDGLAHDMVDAALHDREGHLWFGTSGGLSRYEAGSVTTFGEADGLPGGSIHDIFRDRDGNLWFTHPKMAGQGGVTRYDGEQVTTFTVQDGLVDSWLTMVYQDRDGHLWFGTHEGVTRYDGDTFTSWGADDGLADGKVWNLLQDRNGVFWFGTGHGLTRYDGDTFTTFGPEDGLPDYAVCPVLEDGNGYIWLAASGHGATRFDGVGFETFGVKDGLAHDYVIDIIEAADATVWFATHGGICQFDGEHFTTYTTEDGLTSNDVHAIVQDAEGAFWIGTDGGGVSRFDGKVFQSLTRHDGLPDNVALSVAVGPDGAMWFSSNNGVTRYRPRKTAAFPVFINAVVADRRYPGGDVVSVPSTVDLISFEYRGTSLKTRPNQLVYRYHLRGHDDAWRQTRDTRVEYTGLPRGDYVFEVQSVDRDLNYSEEAATVHLTVRFPFERLSWSAALVVAVILVVWQAGRVVRRDRRLQDSNRELQEKTAALERAHHEVLQASQAKSAFLANVSHELRTPMNAIINFSALILENAYGDISADLREAVEEIDQNSDSLLALINDVLDLSKIEAGAMELRRAECAPESCIDTALASLQHKAAEGGLLLVRDISEDLPSLWADERRLTQHVLVNLVRNAIKFTPRGEIRVGASRDNGDIRFWVADMGSGIPADQAEKVFEPFYQIDASTTRQAEGTGLGLAIVRRFVEMHGGRIWLESRPGRGSTFTFTIPVQSPEGMPDV